MHFFCIILAVFLTLLETVIYRENLNQCNVYFSICPQVLDNKVPLPAKPSVLNPPNSSHRPVSPSSSSGLTPSPELRHSPVTPPTLEELKNQLRDLRASIELLKSQHRYSNRSVYTYMHVCGCVYCYLCGT